MSRIKSPGEKKSLSLRKDHRVFTLEGNKSFRSAWPAKKAKANRQFRRAGSLALECSDPLLDPETPAGATAKPKRSLKKYGVVTLGQSISVKHDDSNLRWNMRVLVKNPASLRVKSFKQK